MATAKGIQSHKIFKLGKAAAKRDKRNFKFAALRFIICRASA
jgi:hypothetical protein